MSGAYEAIRNPAVDMSESTVTAGMDAKSWDMVGSLNLSLQLPTGEVLLQLAEAGRDDIVVCTADLGRPTQVINFGRRYPDRYFNFGIAERNMIGAAAGLATTGFAAGDLQLQLLPGADGGGEYPQRHRLSQSARAHGGNP